MASVSDFTPDLLTLQEEPPASLPRALVLSVCALVAVLLVWASFAKLDVIASAEGRLVPVSFTKVVQPADAGIVEAILVKEGDLVKQGQVLMRLDARLSGVDVGGLEHEVALKRLSLARIEAELKGQAMRVPSGAPRELIARVEAQFAARRAAYQDAVAQETAALARSKADLEAARQIRDKLQGTLPMLKQAADSFQKLQKEGFMGELAANEKQREYLERERDLKSQESTVMSLAAAVNQSQAKLVSIQSNYRSQLETERVELLATLNKSSSELDKSRIKGGLLEIRAPNDGVVKDLAVTTKGAVVAAGALLMNIVPQQEDLQAEVQLRNEDVGFVMVGQSVQLKVAAYPFQRYGLLPGKVALVSADSADPAKAAAPTASSAAPPAPLSYRALIRLEGRHLKSAAQDQVLALNTGMLVTAEIHQRQRTVMEYLLSPVLKVAQESGRER